MDDPKLPRVHVTEIVEENGRTVEHAVSQMICDFCGDITPVWDYDCADFEYDLLGVAGGSEGGWLACGPCGRYIEMDDREKLADRAIMSSPFPHGTVPWVMQRDGLRRLHALFFANRQGERRRWDGEQPE